MKRKPATEKGTPMEKPLLTQDELNEALAKSPSPNRITPEYLTSRIAKTEFMRLNSTVTLCQITLDNGYSVRGESACVDPANYRQDIGEKVAHDQAFAKLWPLFGFVLAEKLFVASTGGAPETENVAA